MIYLDTSAAAKALIDEDGSDVVRKAFADGIPFVSSKLLAVELHAVADRRAIDRDAAQELLDRVALVSLGDDTLERAIDIHCGLRTLDALHLATALELGDTITSILTFDREFAAVAARLGIPASDQL
ncbi:MULTISPECIES: type II toxin-antitoxin system VapC family toxin [unclassified Microbacterium]|uniref:type II toxin-antitoxin system VapC family toxin n=1 Tax=unclassified Microbacterium TaxID=2609290 RepID=UPI0016006CD2|nr:MULTISPECIES: type II toxin-antitoxin system VapC family toxin [unclassified Microbacterium]MBT2484259.1 type II toxin-antitoxin system VapC family toxin [Microbacterium sp. ISL-108]